MTSNKKSTFFGSILPTPHIQTPPTTHEVITSHAQAIDNLQRHITYVQKVVDRKDIDLRLELKPVLLHMRDDIEQLHSDMTINEDHPEVTVVGILRTHEQRLNDIERFLVGKKPTGDSDTKAPIQQKTVSGVMAPGAWTDADGNILSGVSVSVSDMSENGESDMSDVNVSDSQKPHTYAEVKYLRGIYPGLPVKEFCEKFGLLERTFYRAMKS